MMLGFIALTHMFFISVTDQRFINWTLRVASVHGLTSQLPFIKSIEVSFSDNHNYKDAVLDKQPFLMKR
jgi:mono-ADP-ribosyltransferase sirtuin 6